MQHQCGSLPEAGFRTHTNLQALRRSYIYVPLSPCPAHPVSRRPDPRLLHVLARRPPPPNPPRQILMGVSRGQIKPEWPAHVHPAVVKLGRWGGFRVLGFGV